MLAQTANTWLVDLIQPFAELINGLNQTIKGHNMKSTYKSTTTLKNGQSNSVVQILQKLWSNYLEFFLLV